MNLDHAAASRHDPNTREQLVTAGFLTGHARGWVAADGRRIHADAFEFADTTGALSFQRHVNRYACAFSNEAFDGPHGGIGLQVRWSRGDPIEEQVSWVQGRRRYLVSVRALVAPADHERVLTIAQSAIQASRQR